MEAQCPVHLAFMAKRKSAPVQMTNDSSSVSKMSAVDRNYWTDPFLRLFVRKTSRRAALINRGYYIRLKAVDYAVSHFINDMNLSPAWQIVSYGAGFDTTFFRLASKGTLQNAVFYEIDFPDVVKRKSEIIMRSPELRALLGHCDKPDRKIDGYSCIATSRYRLVPIDLNDVDSLSSRLQGMGIDVQQPSLFLSECALTYLKSSRSSSVIEWTAKTFQKSMFVTYEQVYPLDGFGNVMLSHFESCHSPLKSIISYPTPRHQEERYKSLGFDVSCALDMNYFYHKILDDHERDRIYQLEQFDEFEEWHLKCSHYVLIMSTKGITSGQQLTHIDKPLLRVNGWKWESFLTAECVTSTHLQRFGHASAASDLGAIIFGGFGLNGKQHARLNSAALLSNYEHRSGGAVNCLDLPVRYIGVGSCSIPSLMFHSLTALGDGQFLIAGGRGSPLAPSSSFFFLCLKYSKSVDGCFSHLNESSGGKDVVLEWIELEMCGDPFVGRWRHTASLISIKDDDKRVVLFGGRTSNFVLDDAVEINVKEKTVSKLKNIGDVPGARHSHSAAVRSDQHIIMSGGLTESETALSDVYIMRIPMRDSKKDAVWEKMDLIPAIEPRYGHSSHIYGDLLFLVGGIQMIESGCGGLTIINMTSRLANSFDLPHCSPGKPVLLHKHTSELLWDTEKRTGRMLIVGGGGTCFSFGTHINCGMFIVELGREVAFVAE